MKVPFQIYDFLSILFPGVLFIFLFQSKIDFINWSQFDDYGSVAVLLVLIYIIGDALSRISSFLERSSNKLIDWIIPKKKLKKINVKKEIKLNGRTSVLIFSKDIGEEIVKSVNEFYGIKMGPMHKQLFELVYAPVHDRMGKRETFLAIANMMRSFALLALINSVYLVIYIVPMIIGTQTFSLIEVLLLVVSVSFYFIFIKGYQNNKFYSEIIPYTAFLAWYKEKLIK